MYTEKNRERESKKSRDKEQAKVGAIKRQISSLYFIELKKKLNSFFPMLSLNYQLIYKSIFT